MPRRLCCCEYIDQYGENNHILGCCCNCHELDDCFERLITGQKISSKIIKSIMSAAYDRFRIPWLGGAKKLSLDAILPIILLPLFIICGTQGVWMSVVSLSFLPIFLIHAHFLFMKFYSQTYFFYSWNLTSILLLFILFEGNGVFILEIREDENLVFCCLTIASLFSIYKVKQKAKLSFVLYNCQQENCDKLHSNYCNDCNISVPERAYHCHTCRACLLQRDQHCAWLNCCIGQFNHSWYMIFLITNFCQLIFCSNLILTTACHPFRVWGPIMLPDDCTDVYFDNQFATCFVTSLYCIEASVFIGAVLLHECWLITIGMTGNEFRLRNKRTHCCGLLGPRPYSKGFILNWINYFKSSQQKEGFYYNI